jgi:FkbM family methyltransferase
MRASVTQEIIDQLHISERRRIQITRSCRDSEPIPKVPLAGLVGDSDFGPFQLMHDGSRVLLGAYHGTWMSAIIQALQGHHEPQEEWAFYQLLQHIPPGSTMMELGGFWAYYSLWFHRQIPQALNYVIEPDPKHLDIGIKNFQLNGCKATFLNFTCGEKSNPQAGFQTESGEYLNQCPCVCVDDLLEQQHVKHVALLHADIQGAELAMLRGARNAIRAGKIRFIFLSTHHASISNDPHTHRSCLDFVHGHNGHLLAEFPPEQGFSGDGLIVASFDPMDRGIQPFEISRNLDPELAFWKPIDPPPAIVPVATQRPNLVVRGIRKIWRIMRKFLSRAA